MGYIKNELLGIACDVESILRALGREVDEEEFDAINVCTVWGGPRELGSWAREIARALEDAPQATRDAFFSRACIVTMELDELAGARAEPVAA